MTLTAFARRRWALAVALLAAIFVIAYAPSVVGAAPGAPLTAPDTEGGTKTLRDQLDAAARGYLEAKAKYDFSVQTQNALAAQMRTTGLRIELMKAQVGAVASASYRSGRLGVMTALLASGSPESFLERAASVEMLAIQEDAQLAQLARVQRELAQQRDQVEAEVRTQAGQLAAMEKRKKDAERALAAVGGGRPAGGFLSSNSPAAKPAPRNADGSWPRESCIVDDPTTAYCLTPRTNHAYQQTKAAGFTRYVSCYRPGDPGEHGKGRACDWAAATGGFADHRAGAANGEKTYGDRLASWYVENASRLGVMYVIWYKQIWMPGTGWRSYSGNGTVNGDHYNHVHLSML